MAVLLIIMPRSLTCSLSSMFESSYDLQVDVDFLFFSFPEKFKLVGIELHIICIFPFVQLI